MSNICMYETLYTYLYKYTHISMYSFIVSILILTFWELLQKILIQSAKGILLTHNKRETLSV